MNMNEYLNHEMDEAKVLVKSIFCEHFTKKDYFNRINTEFKHFLEDSNNYYMCPSTITDGYIL